MIKESPPAAFVQPSPGSTDSGTFTLAGCTGIARVGICIRCERLYLGGPQIAPLAKRENGVYHCIEFVSNGQRLADKPKESHENC